VDPVAPNARRAASMMTMIEGVFFLSPSVNDG